MSTRNMIRGMTSRERAVVEDNTRLISWISEIYGIFWGVWLASFTEEFLSNCRAPFPLLTKVFPVLYVAFFVLVAVYTYFLVKWLWSMRFILPDSGYRLVFAKLGRAGLTWVFVVLFVLIIRFICSIAWGWVVMGIFVSVGWHAVVSAIVLVDREGWR